MLTVRCTMLYPCNGPSNLNFNLIYQCYLWVWFTRITHVTAPSVWISTWFTGVYLCVWFTRITHVAAPPIYEFQLDLSVWFTHYIISSFSNRKCTTTKSQSQITLECHLPKPGQCERFHLKEPTFACIFLITLPCLSSFICSILCDNLGIVQIRQMSDACTW